MDKKLINHKIFIEKEIKRLKREIENAKNQSEIDTLTTKAIDLDKYHNDAIDNFQHERLIHLLVTFFFAFLLITSIILSLSFALSPDITNNGLLSALSGTICLILLVTEIFYIRHYYILENNTEKLYDSSSELYSIIKKLR